MKQIGWIVDTLFDALLFPLRPLGRTPALVLLSLAVGIGLILFFRITSDQSAIAGVRRRMGAAVAGMILFVGRPSIVLREGLRLILLNFLYLFHLLRPLAIMSIPLLILFAQLDARFGKSPPSPGETALVTLQLSATPENRALFLSSMHFEPELALVEPVVLVEELSEASFRVTSNEPGLHGLGACDAKGMMVPCGPIPTGVIIPSGGSSGGIDHLLRPSLRPLSPDFVAGEPAMAGPLLLQSATIQLHGARYDFGLGSWTWIPLFLLFSALGATAGALRWRVRV